MRAQLLAWLALVGALSTPQVASADLDVSGFVGDPVWRLYALEHAASENVPASRLIAEADSSERVAMSWGFFVAVGHDRVVLIDTGTDALAAPRRAALQRRWGVVRAVTVVDALSRLHLAPSAVTDVVLTHYHWDHSEGLIRFPRARVHVQRDEWPRVAGWVRATVDESRVSLFHRRATVLEGLEVRVAGYHTRRHSFVDLRCRDRSVVVVGDAVYLPRNIDPGVAVAVTGDAARTVQDVAAAVEAVGADNVLASHDPSLYTRFASDVPGAAVICR